MLGQLASAGTSDVSIVLACPCRFLFRHFYDAAFAAHGLVKIPERDVVVSSHFHLVSYECLHAWQGAEFTFDTVFSVADADNQESGLRIGLFQASDDPGEFVGIIVVFDNLSVGDVQSEMQDDEVVGAGFCKSFPLLLRQSCQRGTSRATQGKIVKTDTLIVFQGKTVAGGK